MTEPASPNVPELLTAVQQLVVGVSALERRHFRPRTEQRENVAEHSLSVATLAWFLHGQVRSRTDLDLVIRYALVHDFVEVYAGDVNTFASSSDRAAKEIREQEALERLGMEFAEFSGLVAAMRAYQEMNDDAARFVWTVDKIQALIMGQMDGWRAYREAGITRERFEAKMAELLERAAPELQEVYRGVIAWSRETY